MCVCLRVCVYFCVVVRAVVRYCEMLYGYVLCELVFVCVCV